jgi:hypothetical protein
VSGEINLAAKWIVDTLKADGTLTAALSGGANAIYQDVAPAGAGFPYVVFFLMDPGDTLNTTGTSQAVIWQPTLWMVKGVHKTASYAAPLATIEARIFSLLHKRYAAVTGGNVWSAVRQRPFQMSETGPGGEQYRHAGGVYRIKVS